ncbi:MAG: hypothetical protein JM58_16240 [Peptococcaceae bacterium BICA1-8]|nr:MAG: hypothetical protein JM58_16240 [Peptococcaceae bacterium BICA1-8]
MKDGYAGRILEVNLTTGAITITDTPQGLKENFLGGCGFGAKLLYEKVPAKADPLGPENAVIMATGPITGTLIPSSAMLSTTTKSPLTNIVIRSLIGGFFATELKQAGYDALIITGAANKPIYLFIDDDEVQIKDASNLWGKNTFETQEKIKNELGYEDLQIATIGQAGENLIRYACLIGGARASGRGGLGAVFGSKMLKAVVVHGTKTIQLPNTNLVLEHTIKLSQKLKQNPASKSFPKYGSTASPASYSSMGIFGSFNWQREVFEDAELISGEHNTKRGLNIRSKACHGCLLSSGHVWMCGSGIFKGQLAEGPEYETLYSIGSMCGNNNFDSIVAAEKMCDEYGIDTITFGATVALAMECFEKGILTTRETDGIELNFGNHQAILDLIPKIVSRSGFGDWLAEGSRRLATRLGSEAEKFVSDIKGLEMAGHSARAHKGQALGYATSNRGGSHQDTRVTPERSGKFDRAAVEGKGKLAKESQDMTTIGDALTVCRRSTEALYGCFLNNDVVELVNIVTGQNYSLEDITKVAERIYTMEKLFNVREGLTRKEDTLPPRIMNEPIPDGASKGMYVPQDDLNRMLDEYYQIRGWDKESSYPSKESLRELGLECYLNDLYED